MHKLYDIRGVSEWKWSLSKWTVLIQHPEARGQREKMMQSYDAVNHSNAQIELQSTTLRHTLEVIVIFCMVSSKLS